MAKPASITSATRPVELRSTAAVKVALAEDSFRHEALFDNGEASFDGSLPAPPAEHEQLLFTRLGLGAVRNLVSLRASEAGLGLDVGEELVLAINELATNSVQYGGGGGALRIWREPDAFVCEVRDHGFIRDPLVGRLAPPVEQHGGRGWWLVNQLCDLVQIRSAPSGTVVRVHTQVCR